MDEKMNIQWYPGHMTKTRRQIEADLKQVDAVCEIVDARIPMSSRNPDIDAICGDKPRIMILNRMDLADPTASQRWADYFRNKGMAVAAVFAITAMMLILGMFFVIYAQRMKLCWRHRCRCLVYISIL